MVAISDSNQKSYYYISEETMAGNKDYVDRWQEAYDPKGAIKALHSAIVKLKEARGNTA